MIPQLASQTDMHLTGEQFGDLLAGGLPDAACRAEHGTALAQTHLLRCERCATELADMRESLSLFREASNAHAEKELRHLPRILVPARPVSMFALEPAYWVAAASILLAAIVPMQRMHRRAEQPVQAYVASVPSQTVESDETLLDDVDNELSASVPAPMQALADPTSEASPALNASVRNSDQRKD